MAPSENEFDTPAPGPGRGGQGPSYKQEETEFKERLFPGISSGGGDRGGQAKEGKISVTTQHINGGIPVS